MVSSFFFILQLICRTPLAVFVVSLLFVLAGCPQASSGPAVPKELKASDYISYSWRYPETYKMKFKDTVASNMYNSGESGYKIGVEAFKKLPVSTEMVVPIGLDAVSITFYPFGEGKDYFVVNLQDAWVCTGVTASSEHTKEVLGTASTEESKLTFSGAMPAGFKPAGLDSYDKDRKTWIYTSLQFDSNSPVTAKVIPNLTEDYSVNNQPAVFGIIENDDAATPDYYVYVLLDDKSQGFTVRYTYWLKITYK